MRAGSIHRDREYLYIEVWHRGRTMCFHSGNGYTANNTNRLKRKQIRARAMFAYMRGKGALNWGELPAGGAKVSDGRRKGMEEMKESC